MLIIFFFWNFVFRYFWHDFVFELIVQVWHDKCVEYVLVINIYWYINADVKNKYKYTCFNHLDVFQLISGYFEFDQWVMINFEKNILVLIILCKLVEIKRNGIEYCKSFRLFTCKKKKKIIHRIPCFLTLKFQWTIFVSSSFCSAEINKKSNNTRLSSLPPLQKSWWLLSNLSLVY